MVRDAPEQLWVPVDVERVVGLRSSPILPPGRRRDPTILSSVWITLSSTGFPTSTSRLLIPAVRSCAVS